MSISYNFDILPDRLSTESVKWHEYEADVLPMWVADMDFRSPEPVIQALRQRVEHGVFGYPVGGSNLPKEIPEFRQLIVDRLEERYNWQVEPEDLLLIPSVVTGFNLACHALAASQGEVIVMPPIYYPVLSAPANAGMARQDVELARLPDGTYAVDWQAYEAAIHDQTRLFILCNPHNPVGRVFRKDELTSLAETCLKRGVVICSDEIHCDLVFNGYRHIPIASLDPQVAQSTITLIAPSKTFNLAGLQCGIAVIQNPSLRNKFRHAHKGLAGWVNVMGLVAAQAAYRYGEDWLQQLLVYLESNRDYLVEFVTKEMPGIEVAKPEGTYLAWLDCRRAGIDGNPTEFFLKHARVALNDGAKFGKGGEGFVRLNFGCPRSMLAEALERMKIALENL